MTARRSPLRKARALISDPKNWTRGASARDPSGREVYSHEKAAFSFCALGAIDRTCAGLLHTDADHALSKAANALGELSYITFNDEHTHDEVLWAFDLAIAFDEVGYP